MEKPTNDETTFDNLYYGTEETVKDESVSTEPVFADNEDDDPQDRMKMNFIKAIDVNILDNSKRTVANIKYSRCFPINISSLDLDYTNGNEVDFTVTFKFTEINFAPVDKQ